MRFHRPWALGRGVHQPQAHSCLHASNEQTLFLSNARTPADSSSWYTTRRAIEDHPMTRTAREHAVLHLLCFATSTYENVPDYPGRARSAGSSASSTTWRRRPTSSPAEPRHAWHAVRLHGYGQGRLSDYFQAVPPISADDVERRGDVALGKGATPQVVSHLLHALYTPLENVGRTRREFDVAMHGARRSHEHHSPAERILIWDEDALLREAAKHLGGDEEGATAVCR